MTKDEALDLALDALLDIPFDSRNPMQKEAITAIKQARSAPVQDLQRTGCSAGADDECTNKACARACPALAAAAQPAPVQEPDHSDELTIAYMSGVHRGKELAVAQAVPNAFGTREGEHPQYIQGWNDCRAEMLSMRKRVKP
jgi:hypothetical protein